MLVWSEGSGVQTFVCHFFFFENGNKNKKKLSLSSIKKVPVFFFRPTTDQSTDWLLQSDSVDLLCCHYHICVCVGVGWWDSRSRMLLLIRRLCLSYIIFALPSVFPVSPPCTPPPTSNTAAVHIWECFPLRHFTHSSVTQTNLHLCSSYLCLFCVIFFSLSSKTDYSHSHTVGYIKIKMKK